MSDRPAPLRRRLLLTVPALAAAAGAPSALWAPSPAHAQARRAGDPLVLGVEGLALRTGLAKALLAAVGRDTGMQVRPVEGEGPALVAAIERGEFDAILTQAPQAELLMERRGLIHDRRPVAIGQYVLAGPAGKRGDPAGVRGLGDAALAAARLAAAGQQGACRFVSQGGTGPTAVAEAAFWKSGGPVPFGDWMLRAGGAGPLDALRQAAEQGAYVLVERGLFAAAPDRRLELLVQGDARLDAPYHVMRGFRTAHPGAKLLVNWLAGPGGRAVVKRLAPAYRSPA
jgi:tungstate transport system substrate-binding protein